MNLNKLNKITVNYILQGEDYQDSIGHFNQDPVDELIRLLGGRELFAVHRDRSDKLVTNTVGSLRRSPVLLPLDHPEMLSTKVEKYILTNGQDINKETITLGNEIYRSFSDAFKRMVSVEVILRFSSLERIESICETINDVYSVRVLS